jgi:type VI secretion system secreted protein Hcp
MAQQDFFLDITGIKGESIDKTFKDKIEVHQYHFSATNDGTTHHGKGGGGGKVSASDLACTTYVGKHSPNLWLACCNGKHFDTVTFYARKQGESQIVYIKLSLKNVIVSSYSAGGGGAEPAWRTVENFTLNFADMTYEYTPQTDKGGADSAVTTHFNVAEMTQ